MDWNEDNSLLGISKKNKFSSIHGSTSKSELPPEISLGSKKGGWAEEGVKLKNKTKTNLLEQERFREQKIDDSDDDIPVIPDLEDLQEDLTTDKVSKPPLPAINNLTYKELDFELSAEDGYPLSKAKLKTKNGDISLSLLTKYLHCEKDVKDPDVIWTMESLWSDITK